MKEKIEKAIRPGLEKLENVPGVSGYILFVRMEDGIDLNAFNMSSEQIALAAVILQHQALEAMAERI